MPARRVPELELENPQLLRVLAHRLEQTGHLGDAIRIFKHVLEMRPEEPQSYRDLALALILRAEKGKLAKRDRADFKRAIELLSEVVMRHWDRFAEIEVIALVEINRILPAAHELGISPAIGAFLAGMLLAESPFATQVRADVGALKTLLMTLFFGSIGMLLSVPLTMTIKIGLDSGERILLRDLARRISDIAG